MPKALYGRVAQGLRDAGLSVETGRFAAFMELHLVGDGPVTLRIDTEGGRIVC